MIHSFSFALPRLANLGHRHAMLVDQKTEGVIVPLNEFLKSEGRLELANSTSEFITVP